MTCLSYVLFFIATVGFYPFYQVMTAGLVCNTSDGIMSKTNAIFHSEENCFGPIHSVQILVVVICVCLHYFLNSVCWLAFFDPNPNSNKPYSSLKGGHNIVGYLLTALVPIASIVDYSSKIKIYIVILFVVIFLIQLVDNIRQPGYYSATVNRTLTILACVRVAIYLAVIINYVIFF